MAAESEQADESGVLPGQDSSSATAETDKAGNTDDVEVASGQQPAPGTQSVPGKDVVPHEDPASDIELSEDENEDEVRPEDVREGVVDLVAYAVGAAGLILLGYFTQRDVLTWTRGPFTVVVIIMAVHWIGRRVQARRVQARREKVGGAR
ncbi:hypothetical protein [Yinghuangia sp. YIM S09857]|uniref:hypothetical protein n=1 Tax=Yinghuangia sp. YIM S09857 TaxID=3436929 RepID=UPI003F53D127